MKIYKGMKCPRCKKEEITMLYGLEKKHRGGNKWCLACGKIFDEKSTEEKMIEALERT